MPMPLVFVPALSLEQAPAREFSRSTHGAVRGLSLIELLVSMAIGLVVTLAITTVLINSNASQRTSTSVNDAVQTGAFASLSIDRLVRSAGSGFVQFRSGMGCVINASVAPGPTAILPPASALPPPFAGVGTATVPVQLAPVVILDGGVSGGVELSDQLIVMSGSHGFSESASPLMPQSTAGGTTGSTSVLTTLGLNPNDLVLIADNTPGGGCMVQQILSTPASPSGAPGSIINFGNKYYAAAGSTINLTAFNTLKSATLMPLGSAGATAADADPNLPSFFVYGVDPNDHSALAYKANTLVRYNLLSAPNTPVEALAENVMSIQAIYGTDAASPTLNQSGAAPTPSVLNWEAPSGDFAGDNTGLLAGTVAAKARFPTIKAVRIAMVLKSAVQEKEDVGVDQQMFTDTGVVVTYTVPTADKKFRHRVVETLIPLRNL